MLLRSFRAKFRNDKGQGLIEAAVILPFLFLLLFNAINFAYFFYVGINLASAPRNAVTYSIQGFSTPEQTDLPDSSQVWQLANDNMVNGLTGATNTPIQVCTSKDITTTNTTGCTTYGSPSLAYTPDADPEPTKFFLNRVDVTYTLQPLIAGQPFGITLLPSYTLHRQVSMRALD